MHREALALSAALSLLVLAAAPSVVVADHWHHGHGHHHHGDGHFGHGHFGHSHFGHSHFGHSHFGHGHFGHGDHFGGYVPYGYQIYGYSAFPGYGVYDGLVVPGYGAYGPLVDYAPPPIIIQPQPFPFGAGAPDNPVLNDARAENDARWNLPLAVEPVEGKAPRLLEPSTVEAKLRSMRSQAHGDEWFRKLDFLQAYPRYKQAIEHARDRAEPYFRLALTYAGLGRHSLAIRELKRGLELDPSWPSTGVSLDQFFGEDNRLAKSALMGGTLAWVREDIRDPDRLFLLGVLLHFDDDERSRELFEAAYRLAGGGQHLAAFLNPVQVAPAAGADPVLPPEEPQRGESRQPAPEAGAEDSRPGDVLIPPPPEPGDEGADGPTLPRVAP